MNVKKSQKKPDDIIENLVHFEWGGTTTQWEETADQIMHYLQDQLDAAESPEEKQKKIEYGNQKQYW
ncbi:hypothetical protein [Crassaminicella profunda]|uniref:hypothetical protein n=1 Tax=Crassaminicella profunda TaxID=1286698 RepID=UPI001CA68A4D|nr:hypothetical protein [Crassaminicella profunda]QZY56569.1 hypothetical protein K7H06_06510 [Crassaminicella profunda]